MRNVFAALQSARKRPNLELVRAPTADLSASASVVMATTPGIEASEAAAAIGIDPHHSQCDLWRTKTLQLAKTGVPAEHQEREPAAVTSATYWQKLLEPLVAAVYTKRSGNPVRRSNLTVCHPNSTWMQARVGWEVVDYLDVDLMRYVHVGQHEAGDWTHGIPAHQRIHALHLLAVTGKQAVDLAVLICGEELRIHRVERDNALIDRMMQLQRGFWRCVELNELPPVSGDHEILAPVAQEGGCNDGPD